MKIPTTVDRKYQQYILIIVPPLLIISTTYCFHFTTLWFGQKPGYFAGFLFYWLFWCFVVPLWILGWKNIKSSFSKKPALITHFSLKEKFLLMAPLLLGYGYAFPKTLASANLIIIVSSFIIALVNATLEELLWRATYFQCFPDQRWMNLIYPSISFGLWHYAPQTVFPNAAPGASISFILVATLVGLDYGFVANKYSSIYWTSISHILFDFSGLGGRIYF